MRDKGKPIHEEGEKRVHTRPAKYLEKSRMESVRRHRLEETAGLGKGEDVFLEKNDFRKYTRGTREKNV